MKAITITFLFFSTVFLCSTLNAQTTKGDSIFWNNGNVSFLSDLNGVWIILKNGSPIKDVRITEIKKEYLQMDAMLSYSEFKYVKIPNWHNEQSKVQPPAQKTEEKPEGYTIVSGPLYPNTDTNFTCDTLKEENGVVTFAKIIEINSKTIRYKKVKNPIGPVYIKSSIDAQVTKYNNCFTVTLSEKN